MEYINHLSRYTGKPPTSWKEFLEDIGPDTLQRYPVQQQEGSDCFAYAPKIAITLQTGVSPDSVCFKDYDGGEPDLAAKYFAEQGYGKYEDLSRKFGITYSKVKGKRNANAVLCRSARRDSIKNKLLEYLKYGALVVGIQRCGYPEWHKDHVRFTYENNEDAHAVCIIGYYEDKELGPCFVSKCSNKPTLPSTGKFMRKKISIGGENLGPKYYSFALLPLQDWLCNSNQMNTGKLQAIDGVLLYPFLDLEERLKMRPAPEPEPERRRGRRTSTRRRGRRRYKFKF